MVLSRQKSFCPELLWRRNSDSVSETVRHNSTTKLNAVAQLDHELVKRTAYRHIIPLSLKLDLPNWKFQLIVTMKESYPFRRAVQKRLFNLGFRKNFLSFTSGMTSGSTFGQTRQQEKSVQVFQWELKENLFVYQESLRTLSISSLFSADISE